jgi:hypothetical protein
MFPCLGLVRVRSWGFAVVLALPLGGSACATRPPTMEAAAPIAIRPGVAERIALMDRYRLNDETRKRMMARPHVWVEEVNDDDAPPPAEARDEDDGRASRDED